MQQEDLSEQSSSQQSENSNYNKETITRISSYSPGRRNSGNSQMDAISVTSTISHLKKKIDELTNLNANTKILMYMVIHDLKHPTESLIEYVKRVMQQLHCT